MSQSQHILTTSVFAKKAGVSAGTVLKWLRSGKIDGHKKNGKWLIAEEEISKVAPFEKTRAQATMPVKSKPAPKVSALQPGGSTYSVAAFSKMTYLTEFGVRLWLKTGRLISATDDTGRRGVNAASLDQPLIKRLLR